MFQTPPPAGLEVGPIFIYYYSLAMAAAVWFGYLVTLGQAKKRQLSKTVVTDAVALLLVSGVIGARIGYITQNLGYYLSQPTEIFHLTSGGLSIHGALAAGAISLYLFAKRRGIPWLRLTDTFALPVLVGQIIGRLGNYLNQELFGYPTNLPWKLFIDPAHRPEAYQLSQFFHPTFLYELLLNGVGLLILTKLNLKKEGQLTAGYLLVLASTRFIVELLRISDRLLLGLSLAQLVSIALAITGLWLYLSSDRGSAEQKQRQSSPK